MGIEDFGSQKVEKIIIIISKHMFVMKHFHRHFAALIKFNPCHCQVIQKFREILKGLLAGLEMKAI